MSLKKQLAARKEVILRKRVAQGERFKGSAELRKQRKRRYKEAAIKAKETLAAPLNEFKEQHLGLDPDEVKRLQDKGLTLEDLANQPQNKDGSFNKRLLSGPTKETYPEGVVDRMRRMARRYGLADKRTDTENTAEITLNNPRGSGRPENDLDISTELETTNKILQIADTVNSSIDLTEIPGVYDTAHSPSTKLHAVITWLITGNLAKTARYLSVSPQTVSKWKRESEWWPLIAKQVQSEFGTLLDYNLTDIIHQTTSLVKDRLEDGDYKYNAKLDKLVRVPVPAKDAIQIMDKAVTSRNLLRGDPTSRSEQVTASENIAFLKGEFEKFSKAKTVEGIVDETSDSDD